MDSDYRESVGEALVSGFRLKVPTAHRTPETEIYHGAFLPLDVALKHPEVLASVGWEHEELKGVPKQGKFVVAPGKVVERQKGDPVPDGGGSGCAGVLLAILVLAALSTCGEVSGWSNSLSG
jgi:hypothetical protein